MDAREYEIEPEGGNKDSVLAMYSTQGPLRCPSKAPVIFLLSSGPYYPLYSCSRFHSVPSPVCPQVTYQPSSTASCGPPGLSHILTTTRSKSGSV